MEFFNLTPHRICIGSDTESAKAVEPSGWVLEAVSEQDPVMICEEPIQVCMATSYTGLRMVWRGPEEIDPKKSKQEFRLPAGNLLVSKIVGEFLQQHWSANPPSWVEIEVKQGERDLGFSKYYLEAPENTRVYTPDTNPGQCIRDDKGRIVCVKRIIKYI